MLQKPSNPDFLEQPGDFRSIRMVRNYRVGRTLSRLILILLVLVLGFLLLPWTQHIRARGYLTTLRPEQRPQTVHSVIAGRIEHWHVREGEKVSKGDTLLRLSEIRDAYFDPRLLERTRQQINAKSAAMSSYQDKVAALDAQLKALQQTRDLKLEQARNHLRQSELRVRTDSMDMVAARAQFDIADIQYQRMQKLHADGLNPLTDLEARQLRYQESQARLISAENRFLASKNDLINARVELISIEQQFLDKIAKAQSERATASSQMYDADVDVAKMEVQYSSFEVRTGYYYVTAPQDGFVTRVIRAGIGEMVSEGEELLSIMPARYDLVVEMYIEPVDLPLIHIGNQVNFLFDGWPSIVFSGWPDLSYGTFTGRVVAIDQFISDNGRYRVLVGPDPDDRPWPEGLRVGGGAVGLALLHDVPVGYEIWRKINGFPPEYYAGHPGHWPGDHLINSGTRTSRPNPSSPSKKDSGQ